MTYKIPLFDLNFNEEEENAVLEVLRSRWISSGPRTEQFELRFAGMLQSPHAVAVANCTVALHLAMKILDIRENDEVICPSLTFVATVNAIKYVNAVPVFADIKSYEDLTIDSGDIEKKITSRTRAIVVMHYGGFACDMDRIVDLASKYNLKVIEDACHGPMSEYKGRKLGTIGDIGCFSFFSNKNISTGEGGMLVTGSRDHYEKARLLRSHGMTSMSYERSKGHSTTYDVVDLGYNYRMDDIRSALGLAQLAKLPEDLSRRSLIRGWYVDQLGSLKGLIIPFKTFTDFSSNYIFTVVLENSDFQKRDKVRNLLAENGIQTSVHYPAVHRFSIYKEFKAVLPHTEYVADNLITLPMYSSLTEEQVDYISETLRKVL